MLNDVKEVFFYDVIVDFFDEKEVFLKFVSVSI